MIEGNWFSNFNDTLYAIGPVEVAINQIETSLDLKELMWNNAMCTV